MSPHRRHAPVAVPSPPTAPRGSSSLADRSRSRRPDRTLPAIRVWLAAAAACLPAALAPAAVPLDEPITASWGGVRLRDWADRVAATTGTPVVIDRRLDPDVPVTIEARAEPLRSLLGQAAASARGDVAVLRGSVRLAPAGTAPSLLAAEAARRSALAKLPQRQRASLEAARAWAWDDGARPRDIVTMVATRANVTIEALDRVPHDHLPAAGFPGLSAAEILDAVLAHYDLRVAWRPGPADQPAAGRIVDLASGSAAPLRHTDSATAAVPRPPGGDRPRTAAGRGSRETFTLRAAAPLDELLGTVARRIGLELRIDEASLRRRGIAPGEIVKLSVADATRDELFGAILEPLGLRWRIVEGRLEVSAPAP